LRDIVRERGLSGLAKCHGMHPIEMAPDQFGERGLRTSFGVGAHQLRIVLRLQAHLSVHPRRGKNRTKPGQQHPENQAIARAIRMARLRPSS
jgi:hypothetical protein